MQNTSLKLVNLVKLLSFHLDIEICIIVLLIDADLNITLGRSNTHIMVIDEYIETTKLSS
jgi:hypothetical protein